MPAGAVVLAGPVSAAPAVETTPAPTVPAPRTAVLAIGALAVGAFAIGTTEFVTMGLLPDIAAGVDASIPSAGHLISAYALGVVVGAPVIAALGARLPRRGLAVGLMAAGHWVAPLFWISIGLVAYGILYFFVHDGLVHQRWPFRHVPRRGYLKRLYQAHKLHHAVEGRDGAVSFGFLYAPRLDQLRETLRRNRTLTPRG